MGTSKAAPSGTAIASELIGDRRLATVLFADLSDSTALGELLDPEAQHFVLASFFDTIARLVERYGGTVGSWRRDVVMAFFGAPVVHEDDAERAVRAALDMEVAIAHLNAELSAQYHVRLLPRVGIDTGEVVAGPLASEVQNVYTIVGAAVDGARARAQVAAPGQVLVGPLTMRLVEHAFEGETLPPTPVAGRNEPITSYHLLHERSQQLQRELSPLVGRQPELGYLDSVFEHARAGHGLSVAIVGEPGVGKSRLVSEFRARRGADISVVIARCASFDANTPYALIAALLRAAFHIRLSDDEATTRANLLRGLAAVEHDLPVAHLALLLNVLGYGEQFPFNPESRRPILFSILRQLVAQASERAPMLIVGEDLQWADAASTAVLTDLAREVHKQACLFIATARPEWRPPWPCERLEVRPLPSADVRTLIAQLIGLQPDDALAETISRRAEGNPLFVEEVARDLNESAALVERGGVLTLRERAGQGVPATVQKVIQARLDRLPAGPRRVLEAAAVCGPVFSYRVVERIAPGPTLVDDLAVLEQERFLLPTSDGRERRYAFRHALIQEVAYQRQLKAQRRLAHGAVGAALETLYANRLDELVSELAFHYALSDLDEKALYWLVRAGDRARALFANGEALSLYGAALERAADGDGPLQAGTLLERIGEVHALVGEYDQAVASFQSAMQRSPAAPPVTVARLWRRIGSALLWRGAYADAEAAFDEGLRLLDDAVHIEVARLTVQVGHLHYRRGDHAAARAALLRGRELASSLGADDLVAEALKHLGNSAVHVGDLEAAAAFNQQSRALYERLEDLVGLADSHANLGIIYRRGGRWDAAMSEHEMSLRLRYRIGDLNGLGTCHNNIAEVHRSRGDPAAAIQAYLQAQDEWSATGNAVMVGVALTGLGAARIELGDSAQGRADLLDAERRFEAAGSTLYLAEMYRYLAISRLAEGDPQAAAQDVERSLEYALGAGARNQLATTQRVQAQIALAAGQIGRARELLEESRQTLRDIGDIAELARTEALLQTLLPG